jgi:hypothetical protein
VVEYWITDVISDHNKIKEVRALMNTIEGLSNPVRYTKEEIVKSINKDDKWYTAILKETRGAQNIWDRGAKLHIIDIDDQKFIRTDRNKTKKDNLDNLPNMKNKIWG